MSLSAFDLFSLVIIEVGAGYALVLCILEYTRARSLRNVDPVFYLGLICFSFQSRLGLLANGLLFENINWVIGIAFSAVLIGPVLIVLLRRITDNEYGGRIRIRWHLLPWAPIFIGLAIRHIFFYDFAIETIRTSLKEWSFTVPNMVNLFVILSVFVYVAYFTWAYISFVKKHKINMLQALASPRLIKAALYLMVMTTLLLLAWLITKELIYINVGGWLITIMMILLLVYQHRYPDFFSKMVKDLRTQKYARTKLTDIDVTQTLRKLEHVLGVEKAYTDGDLRMPELAAEIGISNHQLSRIINESYSKSFYELLNEYRIAEAKRLLTETSNTIIEILYKVGFNSKSSFNLQFSKLTGTTPTKFRQNLQKK